MYPVVAPAGTVVTSVLVDFTVNEADVPLKATAVVPTKCLPVMVIFLPTVPLVGENLVMMGAGAGIPLAICTTSPWSVPLVVVLVVKYTVPSLACSGTLSG